MNREPNWGMLRPSRGRTQLELGIDSGAVVEPRGSRGWRLKRHTSRGRNCRGSTRVELAKGRRQVVHGELEPESRVGDSGAGEVDEEEDE